MPAMEKIASFTVDHLTLEPGVYVSRVDRDEATGCTVTTFDLRMTAPNREPVMNTAEAHTIEHLGATFLRNHPPVGKPRGLLWPHGVPHRFLPGGLWQGDVARDLAAGDRAF